jgi:hypothetical protein
MLSRTEQKSGIAKGGVMCLAERLSEREKQQKE